MGLCPTTKSRLLGRASPEGIHAARTFVGIDDVATVGHMTSTELAWLRGEVPVPAADFGHKWVSLSFPQFGEIGGNAGIDDGVVGGRSDGHRLLDEAVKQEATGL